MIYYISKFMYVLTLGCWYRLRDLRTLDQMHDLIVNCQGLLASGADMEQSSTWSSQHLFLAPKSVLGKTVRTHAASWRLASFGVGYIF